MNSYIDLENANLNIINSLKQSLRLLHLSHQNMGDCSVRIFERIFQTEEILSGLPKEEMTNGTSEDIAIIIGEYSGAMLQRLEDLYKKFIKGFIEIVKEKVKSCNNQWYEVANLSDTFYNIENYIDTNFDKNQEIMVKYSENWIKTKNSSKSFFTNYLDFLIGEDDDKKSLKNQEIYLIDNTNYQSYQNSRSCQNLKSKTSPKRILKNKENLFSEEKSPSRLRSWRKNRNNRNNRSLLTASYNKMKNLKNSSLLYSKLDNSLISDYRNVSSSVKRNKMTKKNKIKTPQAATVHKAFSYRPEGLKPLCEDSPTKIEAFDAIIDSKYYLSQSPNRKKELDNDWQKISYLIKNFTFSKIFEVNTYKITEKPLITLGLLSDDVGFYNTENGEFYKFEVDLFNSKLKFDKIEGIGKIFFLIQRPRFKICSK